MQRPPVRHVDAQAFKNAMRHLGGAVSVVTRHVRAIPTLIAAGLVAISLAACAKTDDAAFGERVRAYLLDHPEVLEEMAAKLGAKKEAQASTAYNASQALLPKYRVQLERDGRDLVANPGGAVTVVQFYDYRCGYCKLAAPDVLKLIADNPDVRFVFKEFPIFHGLSETAARIALTPQVKAKGLGFYRDWMAEKALDDAGIDRALRAAGLDPATVREAAEAPDIQSHIADNQNLATALNIQGTPAFIVGDAIIPGADLPTLGAAILQAKAGG